MILHLIIINRERSGTITDRPLMRLKRNVFWLPDRLPRGRQRRRERFYPVTAARPRLNLTDFRFPFQLW
jgi:hypothetical protein